MMSSGATTARSSSSSRFPFTANQWQELEHQALVYKYMISGIPIPPDLLFSIKTSLDSLPNSKLMLHHPPNSMGWNCFQMGMGFGRKIDPEPGRCRRTDGKKWRCSKEAYPDSKYCERHMHRGRNRSRKPVEVNVNNNLSTPTTIPPPPTAIPISSSISKSPNYPSSDSHNLYNGGNSNSFLYSHSPSSKNMGFLPNLSSHQDPFLLDSASYSHSEKDYRNNNYGHGMMKDEHPFFSETSKSVTDSWHLEPLTMGSNSKQRTCTDIQNGYSYLQLSRQQHKQDEQQQHYYQDIGLKMERGEEDEPQKVMHHFFDEWPHKNNDSSSTTQLSISMPISSHDFFMSHNDKS